MVEQAMQRYEHVAQLGRVRMLVLACSNVPNMNYVVPCAAEPGVYTGTAAEVIKLLNSGAHL
jgi:hypothetical protein